MHLGGVGLYASQKDYLTVLRHLLQIKGVFCSHNLSLPAQCEFAAGCAVNPILSRASVDSMFTLSLSPTGATTLFQSADPDIGLPEGAAQYGHGLFVNTSDVPGKRKSGCGACKPPSCFKCGCDAKEPRIIGRGRLGVDKLFHRSDDGRCRGVWDAGGANRR